MPNAVQVPTFNEAQLRIINRNTPKEFILQRVGRGGLTLDYVEVGYVVQQLNEAFNFMWDFVIDDQKVGLAQVWVKGSLRVHISPDFSITKSAFGGSDIKKSRDTGDVIDIADDLKAASADSLKKCASLIGIAADVYYPRLNGRKNG